MPLTMPTKVYMHWNYFLALEADLEFLSRYIELTEDNYDVYSTELIKILFAACSGIDAVTKSFCEEFGTNDDYSKLGMRYDTLKKNMNLFSEDVHLHKYELTIKPFEDWTNAKCPNWWTSYNNVKHNLTTNYHQGNLRNCVSAIAGLFLISLEYYCHDLIVDEEGEKHEFYFPKEYLSLVLSEKKLLRLSNEFYKEE